MKKILLMFAVCAMFVACGGEKKAQTIEERCDEYARVSAELTNQAIDICESVDDWRGDATYQDLKQRHDANDEAFTTWLHSLSDEDRARAVDCLQDAYDRYPYKSEYYTEFPH